MNPITSLVLVKLIRFDNLTNAWIPSEAIDVVRSSAVLSRVPCTVDASWDFNSNAWYSLFPVQ